MFTMKEVRFLHCRATVIHLGGKSDLVNTKPRFEKPAVGT